MRPDPLILAFDTSAAHSAAAVLLGQTVLAEATEDMATGQAERLMGLLSEVLAKTGHGFADLAAIAVGIGPGNFTGIRISVAAARGLALALGIPTIGVSRLEALAQGKTMPVTAVIDAGRTQVYAQSFPHGAPELTSRDQLAGPLAEVLDRPLAVILAQIAALRLDLPMERPAPLYIRPPDAAPARALGLRVIP